MTTALAERDDLTVDGEIIEHPASAPMTLFGTTDPVAVVERASAIATALASIINDRELFTRIGGKKHVQVEGWTLLGSMVGVFAEVEWSRPVDDGWEARAVARTLAGNVVGAAEAMCTAREGRWKSADPYAVRSMSQTRAVSKALRLPLGFIMHLAGYSATPAEELADDQPQGDERTLGAGRRTGPRSATTRPAASPSRTPEEQALLDQLVAKPGMTKARLSLLADAVNVPKGERANADQLRAMLVKAEQPGAGLVPTAPGVGEPGSSDPASPDNPPSDGQSSAPVDGPVADTAQPEVDAETPGASPSAASAPTDEQILAVTGGEIVPPKPGTAEYRALPSGTERAKAKAYWDALKKAEPQQESLAEALGAPERD